IANTSDDYRAFTRVTRSRIGYAHYVPLAIGAALAFAALWMLPGLLMPYFGFDSDLPLIIAVATALVLWVGTFRVSQRVGLKRSFRPNGTFREAKRVTLKDDGIHIETAHSRSHMFWSAVTDVVSTPSHVFVMYDTATGTIVPRRHFGSPADAEAFVA